MNYLEAFAVIFGILSVWYARKENILVFPFGIINVLIFVYIFFVSKLYANAGINIVYFLTNVFGWYNWSRTNNGDEGLQISRTTERQNLILLVVTIILYFSVLFLLRRSNADDPTYINSILPWIDASNSSLFLMATVLMTIKKVENWVFWLAGNIISIPIFLSQELYFTSLQYVVFLVLATLGFIEWRKKHIEIQKSRNEGA